MLYHLFQWLETHYQLPGAQLFQFITFRAAMAVLISLSISLIFGKRIIRKLQALQIGETVRDLGLEGQNQKAGTPTMGGVIILGGLLIPVLLFAKLDNIYIQLMLVVTLILGSIGFADDYIKVFKQNKKGLAGKFKIAGQVLAGTILGVVFITHSDVKTRDFDTIYAYELNEFGNPNFDELSYQSSSNGRLLEGEGIIENGVFLTHETWTTSTTIPFVKNNEFDYSKILGLFSEDLIPYTPFLFIPIVIFILTAVSNGANLTDGLDGLATGTSVIILFTLLVFAYVSGNYILANYLDIMYIPYSGELVIFAAALIGSCIGFLWYNTFPAQVFMGDTGSLALGGIIASLAILVRKELLIPVLCGVFLAENLSVIIQVAYFKYTKQRYGEGKRIFLMSPLHHHFQKKGFPETKIVTRFWIIGIFLAIVTIVTLKTR